MNGAQDRPAEGRGVNYDTVSSAGLIRNSDKIYKSMDDLPTIISSIKSPLLFISRTNFRKIETVKDLGGTMSQLIDRALTGKVNNVQRDLFLSLKNSFSNFSFLDEATKIQTIQEALIILQQIEGETLASDTEAKNNQSVIARSAFGGAKQSQPIDRENVCSLIAERNKVLSTSIQYVKGVGPRIASLMKKKGLETVEDALYFIPRNYEDRRNIKPIVKAEVGRKETLKGTILGMSLVPYHRRKVFEMIVADKSGSIIAKWFNFSQRYLSYFKKRFKTGQEVIISGKIEAFRFQKEISHPDIETIDEEEKEISLHFKRIVPKYSETEGLNQKTLRRIMKNVVDTYAHGVPDAIPREICERRNLTDMSLALRRVHFPEDDDNFEFLVSERSPYHRRIIFDEFFFLELRLALRKRGIHLEKGIAFPISNNFLNDFEGLLPFSLTNAQKRVIHEIQTDMAKPYPMNRLLQGDVGSGKTVVALAAALMAVENNCQVALMAPTELLAEQHYLNIHQLAEKIGLRTAFLSSSTKKSTRGNLYEKVKNGEIDLITGTHAIIQEGVEFSNLGLGIIDEQHRFGVIQRAALKKKGENPHILVMTATPIPRTLAMTVYGDLDISVIDEMPPGRTPIKTIVFHEKDRVEVYEIIGSEARKGRQVYIVYPLIEESEKMDLMDATRMYEHLQNEVFPEFRVALLHGRMKSEEKESVMQSFKDSEVQILVATTVIEVGIDVPQATLMVVEHAERFGLSQLHQLRGRVGRGEHQSMCILLAQYKKSDEARRRLHIMEETNDGFKIAEEDLNIRGPGEFLGVRQSGLPDFRVANIVRDARILNEAREEAFDLVRKDPFLDHPDHFFLKEILRERWKGRFELAGVG